MYDDYGYDDYEPTLRDWAYCKFARVLGKFARLRRWFKYSVLKQPRPAPRSLILSHFDEMLKEIYPATAVESLLAQSRHPLITGNPTVSQVQ